MSWRSRFLTAGVTLVCIGAAACALITVIGSVNALRKQPGTTTDAATIALCKDNVASGRLIGQPDREIRELLGKPYSHSYGCNGASEYRWHLHTNGGVETLHIVSVYHITKIAEIE